MDHTLRMKKSTLSKIKTMNKQISIFLFIILFISNAFSQDTEFQWQLSPWFNHANSVKIKNNNNINFSIVMNMPKADDSICSKISKTDCDSLMTFLSNYSFKSKGSCVILGVNKEYQNTKLLNDSNWILLNGDSIRFTMLRRIGLMFDKDTNKYYYEVEKMTNWTGWPTNYRGRFFINNQIKKKYDIDSGRISEEDYKLNMIIRNLIKKYFPNQDNSFLLKNIESDKPVEKKYQQHSLQPF